MIALSIRRIALAIALFAFGAAALVHPAQSAYACSCMMPPPPGEARDQAQAVFSGVASFVQPGKDGVLVTFDVNQVWKGPSEPQLTLFTSANSASCGYEFTQGEEYIVYGFAQDGQLSTGLCSRTAPLASAGEDVTALGAGQAPQAAGEPGASVPPPAEPSAGVPLTPLVIGGGAVVLVALAAGAAVVLRRRGV